MLITDTQEIKSLEQACSLIEDLQKRLYRCEETLDDLSRAVEIATVSGQYHFLINFLQEARVCLEDRLAFPEPSQEELDAAITIIEDDR